MRTEEMVYEIASQLEKLQDAGVACEDTVVKMYVGKRKVLELPGHRLGHLLVGVMQGHLPFESGEWRQADRVRVVAL